MVIMPTMILIQGRGTLLTIISQLNETTKGLQIKQIIPIIIPIVDK